jgi:hypothetical protein
MELDFGGLHEIPQQTRATVRRALLEIHVAFLHLGAKQLGGSLGFDGAGRFESVKVMGRAKFSERAHHKTAPFYLGLVFWATK